MNKSTVVLGSASELMLKSPPLFREVREREKEKMGVACCVQREREKRSWRMEEGCNEVRLLHDTKPELVMSSLQKDQNTTVQH